MLNTITFENILPLSGGGVCCDVFSTKMGRHDHLEFALNPDPGMIDPDAVALALSTLCGRTYSTISMDLEVSESCARAVEEFTGASVTFAARRDGRGAESHAQDQSIILNFSGGFDSLSAYSLMPREMTKLVSIDWGGRFFREEQFFRRFHPFTMKTNIKDLGYCNESWTFMGIAMMLYAKRLAAAYGVFGGTVENTAEMMWRKPTAGCVCSSLPFSALGISDMRITHGLTEIGNVMVVTKHTPELFADSLVSVAAPKSEKVYRKYVLSHIISKKFGRGLQIPLQKPPIAAPYRFGENLTLDMLAFYEMKNVGREVVEKTLSGMPQEMDAFVRSHKLTFYERLNTNFLMTIPPCFREMYFTRLMQADVIPYDEEDWYELDEVCRFLSRWHPRLALREANLEVQQPPECDLIELPEDLDVILYPRSGPYNWDFASDVLEEGRKYRLELAAIDLFAGQTSHVAFRLYDADAKKTVPVVTFCLDEVKKGASYRFEVPAGSGKCRLIVYAGVPRKCGGVGIAYRNVIVKCVE